MKRLFFLWLLAASSLSAYVFEGTRWPNGTVALQLQLGAAPGTLLDGSTNWDDVALNALQDWQTHLTPIQFTGVKGSTAPNGSPNGKNNVTWSATIYGESFGDGVLAVTLTYYSGRISTEAEVVFNTAWQWDSYRGPERYTQGGLVPLIDFRRVALHEFGHVLGLDHPDEYGQTVTALMNAYISDLDDLAADDITGIDALYNQVLPLPTITQQPAAVTVVAGSTATFSVTATDALFYQWYKNNLALSGATERTLSFTARTSDAGSYSVQVANNTGALRSSTATLVVNPPAPTIVVSPSGTAGLVSGSVTFTVTATNATSYQWFKDNVALTGKTAASLVLSNLQLSDAGSYTVVVTNVTGSATSAAAVLTVTLPVPAITKQPSAAAIFVGATLTLSVTAVNADSYQWYQDGSPLTGATSATLTIPNAQLSHSGSYLVKLTNATGTTTSSAATVSVSVAPLPVFKTQPIAQSVFVGGSVTFTATVNYANTYQWFHDGTAISGATSSSLALTDVQLAAAGNYSVTAANATGSVDSNAVLLTVKIPLVITQQPVGKSLGAGATFTATVVATGATSYQWLFNGANLAGATGATLTIADVQPVHAGNYAVVISNSSGSLTSSTAVLKVVAKQVPTITWSPATVAYGIALGPAQLNAKASVPGVFAYFPTTGTVLNAGPQTLTATFLPEDSATYAANTVQATLQVNAAVLTVTADDQTRAFGTANPPLTFRYDGFVPGESKAALLSEPTASTTATSASPAGVYAITLTGGSAANYTFAFNSGTLTVTPSHFAGTYFSSVGENDSTWALQVNPDNTATFIAYLPHRHSTVVVHLTIDLAGKFTVTGTETIPSAAAASPLSVAAGGSHAQQVASGFVLSGQIGADGTIAGDLSGLGVSLVGAVDSGAGAVPAGLYTASALGTTSGALYAIVGASGQTVSVSSVPTMIDGASGRTDAAGQFTATTANHSQLSFTIGSLGQNVTASLTSAGSSTPVNFAGVSSSVPATKRLVNLSSRAYASTGSEVTIGGFVIAGDSPKRVLLRVIGPSLLDQGIRSTEVLLDPVLELHDAQHDNAVIAANDNWADNANASELSAVAARLGATPLSDTDSRSSAVLVDLPPGVYSFVASGKRTTTGVVLVEAYAADDSTSTFANISTRAFCTTGNGITIGGFVVAGNTPKRLLLRAIGPSLTAQDISATEVLPDPTIEVHDALHDNAVIAANDNWTENANATDLVVTGARVGATPLAASDTKSAALLLTVQPGVYSFVAGGKGKAGVVLVEVYDAD